MQTHGASVQQSVLAPLLTAPVRDASARANQTSLLLSLACARVAVKKYSFTRRRWHIQIFMHSNFGGA
jgi:hypothetical protein